MRVFGEDGRRAGCYLEVNDGEEVLCLGDGRDEEEDEPTGCARLAMVAPPLAKVPAAAALISRHATAPASRVVAGHPVVAPR